MKTELIISPENQALIDMIKITGKTWFEKQIPNHPVYSQFSRKLIVTGQISSEDFIMSGGSSANGIINYEHQEYNRSLNKNLTFNSKRGIIYIQLKQQ